MAKRQIELPPEGNYEVPADLTVADLAELTADARAKATELLSNEAATAEDVEAAERYIAATQTIEARKGELVAAQEEHAARIAAAKAALGTDDPEDADADSTADADEDADKDKTAPVVQAGDVADPIANPTGEPVLVAGGGLTTVKDAGLTVTGRRRSAAAAAAAVSPTVTLPTERSAPNPAYLVAAAEVRGFAAGQVIDWAEFGKAAENRFGALPRPRPGTTRPNGNRSQLAIGSVHVPTHDQALVADGGRDDFAEADEAIEWAVSHARLKEQTGSDSLVAAGGWCAPSETLYDLLDITTDDGMLDTPGITVTRGGVRYSLGPDFTAVYVTGNANFTRTEAQTIAASPTKPMVNIPCPTFTDNRMVVDGLYLTGDILSSKGYPEAYTDYTQKAMKAFAHYVNAASIADQVNLSGTVIDLSTSTGTAPVTNRTHSATVELLGAVELQITDMRYRNRLSMTQACEVILPFWARGNIRTDIAKRQGYENAFQVSDQDIRNWFALRGASVQFVYDWQDAFTGVSAGFGAATAIQGWPNTVNFLIYPEGTFVRALDPVIELNAVYDSVLLQTNQYVALFMEQGRLTLKRHWDARNVKVDFAPLGGTSAGSPVGAAGLTGSVL